MTVAARTWSDRLTRPTLLTGSLAILVGVRAAASTSGLPDAMTTGALFGLSLVAMAALAGSRPARPRLSSLVAGLLGGAVLVCVALAMRWGQILPALTPAAAFTPWLVVTIVVATGEELVLRGVLFDALARPFGDPAALAVTSLAFALMHVPMYGWHVVWLDAGVGLWLGGLRLLGGGTAAPSVAHVLADLATWWL